MNHPLGLDLEPLRASFFDEAADNLERFEQLLLALDPNQPDAEALHALFRCAHSVKGGAATFGLADAAAFTHRLEALLDGWRRGERAPTTAAVDTLLSAGDTLRALLHAHRHAQPPPQLTDLEAQLLALADAGCAPLPIAPAAPAPAGAMALGAGTPPAAAPAATAAASAAAHACSAAVESAPPPATAGAPPGAAGGAAAARELELLLGPPDDPAAAQGVQELFAEIDGLGRIEPLDDPPSPVGVRRFRITSACSEAELLDLIGLHADPAHCVLRTAAAPPPQAPAAAGATRTPPPPPRDARAAQATDAAPPPAAGPSPASATATAPPPAPAAAAVAAPALPGSGDAATLRVPVDKVDQLLDQVGELVVAQSVLQQALQTLAPAAQQALEPALALLQRHVRALQDTVMAVRMVPMSTVFARFPRLLRELGAQLGKRVELVLEGEATELDKGMIERIVDPLTHLVRNALDHGIEPPAERRARGKLEAGRLTISAAQEGPSVLLSVRDDGAGLSRARLLAKARERGLHAPDSLTDAQVWALIFAPGFSTAAAVTEVSGRGVGMDVVARNVAALGGAVEVDSAEGRGLTVRVRLPLTLAILDALLVRVADECYALPLPAVVESFRPEDASAARVGGRAVVRLRDALLPVVSLQQLFRVPAPPAADERRVLVAVQAEGRRIALEVDELVGQQQVVVKDLLANCGRVEHVSAATVLGDGRVALILDLASLVRVASPA